MKYDARPILKASLVLGVSEGIAALCTTACLLGVSLNRIFSIIFCVILAIFAIVFGIAAFRIKDDPKMRANFIIGAILMPIAAAGCIVVDEDYVSIQNALTKSPLYGAISVAIMLVFTISIIFVVNAIKCIDVGERVLNGNRNIVMLILANALFGLADGIVFGLVDIEDATSSTPIIAIVCSFGAGGIVVGILYSIWSEIQTQKMTALNLDPIAAQTASTTAYDEM